MSRRSFSGVQGLGPHRACKQNKAESGEKRQQTIEWKPVLRRALMGTKVSP